MRSLTRTRSNRLLGGSPFTKSWFALNAIFDKDTIQRPVVDPEFHASRGLLSMRSLTRTRSNQLDTNKTTMKSWFALNAIFDKDTIQQ